MMRKQQQMSSCEALALSVCVLLAVVSSNGVQGQLKLGFYEKSCPQAEKIIAGFVQEHIPHAPTLAAPLLRMLFHDCFVRGCDASVLINSTSTNKAEKSSIPNQTLRGFDFIDRVKALLEKECPETVSCADIIALVSRDAVGVLGGPHWTVLTGRRDGLISNASETLTNIPAPSFNFSRLIKSFASKGLDLADLVWLSGAHTIGIAHCDSFSKRLYNFTGKGGPGDEDPSLDPHYAANLRKYKCKTPTDNTTIVEMDPGSFLTFDISYYKEVLKHRGLFQSDAALITDAKSKADILGIVNSPPEVFFQVFARSVQKLGMVQVKTGSEGEIRRHCAVVNPK